VNYLTKVFDSTKTLGSEYHARYQILHIPKGIKLYFKSFTFGYCMHDISLDKKRKY